MLLIVAHFRLEKFTFRGLLETNPAIGNVCKNIWLLQI